MRWRLGRRSFQGRGASPAWRGPGSLRQLRAPGGVASASGSGLRGGVRRAPRPPSISCIRDRLLAERAGCTDAAIRNYEAGRRALKGSALDAIAGALGVAPEALMPVQAESARDALELLFRIEEEFGLRPVGGGRLAVAPGAEKAPKLAAAIKAWESQVDALDRGEITPEEYESWKREFGGC